MLWPLLPYYGGIKFRYSLCLAYTSLLVGTRHRTPDCRCLDYSHRNCVCDHEYPSRSKRFHEVHYWLYATRATSRNDALQNLRIHQNELSPLPLTRPKTRPLPQDLPTRNLLRTSNRHALVLRRATCSHGRGPRPHKRHLQVRLSKQLHLPQRPRLLQCRCHLRAHRSPAHLLQWPLYGALQYFWLAGAIVPIILYLIARNFPRSKARFFSAPLFFRGMGELPPATPLSYLSWSLVEFVFQKFMRNRYRGWWMRFNYITSAGLDVRLAICTIVIIVALNLTGKSFPD